MLVKKAWTNRILPNSDFHSISIRFNPGVIIAATLTDVPPVEPVNGKKLSIQEAMNQSLEEKHLVLHSLTSEDMRELGNILIGLADHLECE